MSAQCSDSSDIPHINVTVTPDPQPLAWLPNKGDSRPPAINVTVSQPGSGQQTKHTRSPSDPAFLVPGKPYVDSDTSSNNVPPSPTLSTQSSVHFATSVALRENKPEERTGMTSLNLLLPSSYDTRHRRKGSKTLEWESLGGVKGLLRSFAQSPQKSAQSTRAAVDFPFNSTQQVDARGSTFNDVRGDQFNEVQVVINNNYGSDSRLGEGLDNYDDPNIDKELNKYPPLLKYGFDVVASATTLITTNIRAAAASLQLPTLPDALTNSFKSLTITKTVYRYSFFSKPDNICTTICTSCLQMLRL